MGANPSDDDRRRRIFHALGAACSSTRATGRWATTLRPDGIWLKFIQYLGFGGVIIGLSVFQIEFDFGVPQFRQVFQPMLIAAAAAFGLVAARIMLGRGAAIIAALFAIALRGRRRARGRARSSARRSTGSRCISAPRSSSNWSALTPLFKRPIVFGAVSGLGVSTDRAVAGVVVDRRGLPLPVADQHVAGGAGDGRAGRHPHRCLRRHVRHGAHRHQRLPRRAIGIGLVALTVLAIGGATANGLRYEVPQNATATIDSRPTSPGRPGQRMVNADVRINPPDFVSDNPNWVSVLALAGPSGERARRVVIDISSRSGPGHYRTTQPVPVWGTWKTLLRVHDGETLTAVPIYLAGDPGIGAKEVPARGVDDAAVRRRDHHPAARAQPRNARRCCGRSAAWWCWSAR